MNSLSKTQRILTPTTLDEAGAFSFLAELTRISGPVVIDFSQMQFALPLGALMFVSAYRRFVVGGGTAQAVGINLDMPAHSYLAHMGFFKGLGLPLGRRPGESAGSSNYIPITVLDMSDLRAAHRSKLLEIYEVPPIGGLVDVEAMKLAKLITQDSRPRINKPIAYCFREIIRNVFEHSGEQRCAVYAQRWTNGFIEVAIVDRGKGIRESLREKRPVTTHLAALASAMAPGVSGNAEHSNGQWANSGFGLFVLSELGKELGSLSLCSGDVSAHASAGSILYEEHNASFSGTAVGLRIKQLSPNKFCQLVDSIVARGEQIVRDRGETIQASKSTRIDLAQ